MREHPEELTEQEQRVVRALHETRETVRAPAGLRTRIEAQRPSRRTQTRRRATYGTALAGALAAAALALALVLPAGSPGGPSVSQAASLALHGPSAPAPGPNRSAPNVKLDRDLEDVYFPNWTKTFGWWATGQRSDRIGGRKAATVYYQRGRARVAYTIISMPALRTPQAQITNLNGTEFRTFTSDGRTVVTWQRGGHTCVLSASGVNADVLRELAAWKVPGETR
ncbi:MAG: hypothetical protein JOZ73_03115 [Solirubrobacterales bacterium]|nr:hypothetical protein [Solirubrobacterales bacterium]